MTGRILRRAGRIARLAILVGLALVLVGSSVGPVSGVGSGGALVEHVGRRSGTVRRSPILQRMVGDRVLVPLPYGRAVHWVRNIRASGHCHMQLHERVYELDEPQVLAPDAVTELPVWQRESALQGPFEFLRLRIFRTLPGTLDSVPGSGESRGRSATTSPRARQAAISPAALRARDRPPVGLSMTLQLATKAASGAVGPMATSERLAPRAGPASTIEARSGAKTPTASMMAPVSEAEGRT